MAFFSHLFLPGELSDKASIPDSVALSIAGDIEFEFDIAPNNWGPPVTMNLLSKFSTGDNQRSYRVMILSGGDLWFQNSSDGISNNLSHGSTVKLNTIFKNNQRGKVKVVIDADNGAGGSNTTFLYRFLDTEPWTQLGAVRVGVVASHFDSFVAISIGDRSGVEFFIGKYYRAIIRDGIDGTVELDAKFHAEAAGTTSFSESSANAATVTIEQSGSPQAEIIKESQGDMALAEGADAVALAGGPVVQGDLAVIESPDTFLIRETAPYLLNFGHDLEIVRELDLEYDLNQSVDFDLDLEV